MRIGWYCGVASSLFMLTTSMTRAADSVPPENAIWPRPTLVPIPESVTGVAKPVSPITTWRTTGSPQGDFWSNNADLSSWTDYTSGGRGGRGRGGGGFGSGGATPSTSGFTSAYRTTFHLPADWMGKRTVLRFEGVADGAKLWVNGQPVRDHWGPLMPWSADITDLITSGKDSTITLGIDERREGLNNFVRGGGLQRDANFIALPANYLSRFHVETVFDSQYTNATLRVWLGAIFTGPAGNDAPARVKLTLKDSEGKAIDLSRSIVELPRSNGMPSEEIFEIPVPSPKKWDAEHPNLYTLEASLLDADGAPQESVARTLGFRQVEVRANRMFVNGQEVKFRGVWGMNSVAQLKALNANHTRQKWVTEQFLNDADRLGMYVLDENPVDFAKYGVESDPQYAHQWLNMDADMVERDRDHPSVIMWGLGNESFNGDNVLKSFKYVRGEDSQRPEMFSWANRVPTDQELPYSIYSSHYPDQTDPNLNLGTYTVAKWHSPSLPLQRNPVPVIPVLHDEYSHVVLNQTLLNRDPNVRNFWGESIYHYWDKMMVTPGALGGDIFGLSGGFGSGSTELYLVHKAYSPIRITEGPVSNPGDGKPLSIPIRNWFDSTNLTEVKVDWTVGSETGALDGPDVRPHAEGTLIIPARTWKDGDSLALKFTSAGGAVIDEFLLPVNPATPKLPAPEGPAPKLEQVNGKTTVTGDHFKVVFDQYKGLIENASYDGKTVLIDGPFLDLLGSGVSNPEWWCEKISAHSEGNEAVVDIVGNYAIIRASFQVRIDGQGLLSTKYTIDNVPGTPPPPSYSPWDATSVGGYSEVGVSYLLPNSATSLSWKRKALWSVYPKDHIGRPEGSAEKGSDDFRAAKEHFYEAAVTASENGPAAIALSDGRDQVRVWSEPAFRILQAGIRLGIHNEWNYPDIGLGNYTRPPILIKNGYSNTVYLRLGEAK